MKISSAKREERGEVKGRGRLSIKKHSMETKGAKR